MRTKPIKHTPRGIILAKRIWGLWVACACGKRFEYLQDQISCPQCYNQFDPSRASSELGQHQYGDEEIVVELEVDFVPDAHGQTETV